MKIPGYTIKRELGRGGMAIVHLAHQTSFGRDIALKVLTPVMSADFASKERFLNECRTVAQLVHPNIIPVFDTGVHNNHYYLSMQYLAGGTLEDKLHQRLSISESLTIITAVAKALKHAHERGVIHRDIKPANILFYEDGTPALSDFGLAKAIDNDVMLTTTGTSVGTPSYISPEVAQGEAADNRSDLYSLGVVLYETLTGDKPFKGDNPVAIVVQHVTAPIPQLPTELAVFQDLIVKMLAKNPAERFSSAAELIQTLEQMIATAAGADQA